MPPLLSAALQAQPSVQPSKNPSERGEKVAERGRAKVGSTSGSFLLASRQPQARQVKLAVLWVAQTRDVRHQDRGDSAQPLDVLSGFVGPAQMGVARSDPAIWLRRVRIILDRHEQLRYRLLEAAAEAMRGADCIERCADAGAGTKAQRDFDMLDRDVGLARKQSECAADMPAAREV